MSYNQPRENLSVVLIHTDLLASLFLEMMGQSWTAKDRNRIILSSFFFYPIGFVSLAYYFFLPTYSCSLMTIHPEESERQEKKIWRRYDNDDDYEKNHP